MRSLQRVNNVLTGDRSGLSGDCTWLSGDCSGLCGNCSGLIGDCTGLIGDCTRLRGDFDDCSLTEDERAAGVNLLDLIKKAVA